MLYFNRLIAFILDLLIINTIAFSIIFVNNLVNFDWAYNLADPIASENARLILQNVNKLIEFLVAFIYFVGFEGSNWGATIGKRILGLKIVNYKKQKISWLAAIVRGLIKALTFNNFFIIIHIYLFANQDGQDVQDLAAKTKVIDENKKEPTVLEAELV